MYLFKFMNWNTRKPPKKKKIEWWMISVPVLVLLTLLFYCVVHSRPGGLIGVMIFYLAPLVIAGLAVIFFIAGMITSIRRKPFATPLRISSLAALLLLCFNGSIYSKYPSSYDGMPSNIQFRVPSDSTITVGWGGANEQVNYHVIAPDQCWAYDLLVMKDGKTFEGDSLKLQSYFSYGLPILSPAAGKVVKTYDSDPDMPVGVLDGGKEPVGNHVIIEVATKQFLFICHLQPKSIQVKNGDIVKQGQKLGLVGNSGNTSEPHIHLHLQDTDVQGLGEGIPLYFYGYTVNNLFIEKGIPTGGIDENGKFIGQIIRHAGRK
jgi:hypothetical protein